MKNYILLSLCFLFAISIQAQDIIVKKDGTEIKAKVLAIETNTVKYKKFFAQDGPALWLSKKDISLIKYINGTQVQFTAAKSTSSYSYRPKFKKNAFGVNGILLLPLPFELEQKAASIEYERLITKKSSVGVRGIYFKEDSYRYQEEAIGIGIFSKTYLFNSNRGMRGLYFGTAVDVLKHEYSASSTFYSWNVYEEEYELITSYEYGEGVALFASAQLGCKINLGKTLFIEPAISGGVSISYNESNKGDYSEFNFVYMPSLTVGVQF